MLLRFADCRAAATAGKAMHTPRDVHPRMYLPARAMRLRDPWVADRGATLELGGLVSGTTDIDHGCMHDQAISVNCGVDYRPRSRSAFP